MADAGRHFSGTNTQLVVKYLRAQTPPGTVERVLDRAGEARPADVLADPVTWSTYEQFRSLLAAVAAELGEQALPAIGLDSFADVSVPESTAMLQSLGSPSSLYADIGPAAAALTRLVEVASDEFGPCEWLIEQRIQPQLDPFRDQCLDSTV